MADEAPLKLVAKKRKLKTKRDVILRCIIHCCNTKASSPISPITEKSFRKIKEACNIRKKQESDFETYGHIIKDIPDEYLNHVHGYHRLCYQKFTNVSKLLKREATTETDSLSHHHLKRRRVSGYSGVLLPSDECLFCGKLRKKRKGKEETLTRCETTSASNLIKEKALTIPDYDIQAKVNDIDLVAREAYYHRSCYKLFTQEDERNSTQARGDEDAKDRNISHAAAFEYISDYITESIINNSNVERLGMLKEKYLLFMQQKYPEHYNPNYKTDKLKDKIQRRFGDKVKFWQPNYRTELIYSTHIQSGQAVEVAFQTAASESRRLEESAMFLRRTIIAAYREARELPWPPPPGNELNEWEFPPEHLSNFLSVLLVGKRMDALSADNTRRVLSIGRDIIYAVTKGKWMTPKHILLGMSVWHLTGRADIVSLLNRFGHCVSYSRLLEILTAIHMAIKDHDSPIPPGIKMQDNQVLHFCWDNFDLNEETASGAGTTHSTHGLAIQETVTGQPRDDVSENVLTTAKTKKRSVKEEVLVMEPCYAKKHIEPSLCSTTLEPQQPQSYVSGIKICDMMWVLCRALPKSLKQTVPSLGGWISLTGEGSDNRKTMVEYMPPINAPITDNTTVMHVLKISQEASAAVGQAYTIITFDLAAAKKAYEILWTYPDRFHNVIIRLGAFHMACALIGSIGKYMKGSGLEEVVVQSAVCASGSIDKVMNGKHYNRARYVIRISLEALERMLLASFQDEKGLVIGEEEMKLMSNLAKTPSKENISIVKSNSKWKEWMQKYEEYRAKVRSGEKGKTAQFWIGYMDKAWLLMRFLRATKENDLTLHIACLHEMCPLFFSQEKPNYARYTSVYLNILLNLPHTHPGAMELIEKNGMSVNRSDVPNSRNAVDITIEQTYNRHASGHGPGIIGFSRNLAAYHRWSCTRHARAGYLQATLDSAGIANDEVTMHKDVTLSEITKGERAVMNMMTAFQNFMNPFNIPNVDHLYCISSGRPVSQEITKDLLTVDTHGTNAYKTFVQERLVQKTVSIHSPIKRMKLKTFASSAVTTYVTNSSKKTKEVIAERNVFGQLILLSMKHKLCMEKVMSYQLGPVPWSLATADGAPVKTEKAKLLHKLEEGHIVSTRPESAVYVIDGNAIFQALTQIPHTFGELAEHIFVSLPNATRVDFVTDTYQEHSIKNIERDRRGTSQEFLVHGLLTRVPRDFKKFLCNSSNKKQLINIILKAWKGDVYASRLKGRQLMVVCGETCWCLSSEDGHKTQAKEVQELRSKQEEADTRMILHCFHIARHLYSSGAIIIRSPDTDVFVLLMKYSQNIDIPLFMDTGYGDKRRLISVKAAVQATGSELCNALLSFHAFTGCDTTSSFMRKGKVGPLRLLKNNPQYIPVFTSLGTSSTPTHGQFEDLEAFTCLLYGARSGIKDINKLRYTMFMARYTPQNQLLSSDSGIDLSLLPPCRSSLHMHVARVNYQTHIWSQANLPYPELQKPYQGHGWNLCGDKLEYKWTQEDILPKELMDLVLDQDEGDKYEEDNDLYTEVYNIHEDVIDYEEFEEEEEEDLI